MNLPNVPKYISLDFFLALIGLFISSAAYYYSIILDVEELLNFFLFICGVLVFYVGFILMLERYNFAKEVYKLENEVRILELQQAKEKLEKKRKKKTY
tara:strand:- start:1006 stop:1299 length:294 start_codon:yes stop_codon:yes gene_type:complete